MTKTARRFIEAADTTWTVNDWKQIVSNGLTEWHTKTIRSWARFEHEGPFQAEAEIMVAAHEKVSEMERV